MLFIPIKVEAQCVLWEQSQGSKGIRQWPINCCTSPMIIHKKYPLCKSQLIETFGLSKPTNQNSIKVVGPSNKKTLL